MGRPPSLYYHGILVWYFTSNNFQESHAQIEYHKSVKLTTLLMAALVDYTPLEIARILRTCGVDAKEIWENKSKDALLSLGTKYGIKRAPDEWTVEKKKAELQELRLTSYTEAGTLVGLSKQRIAQPLPQPKADGWSFLGWVSKSDNMNDEASPTPVSTRNMPRMAAASPTSAARPPRNMGFSPPSRNLSPGRCRPSSSRAQADVSAGYHAARSSNTSRMDMILARSAEENEAAQALERSRRHAARRAARRMADKAMDAPLQTKHPIPGWAGIPNMELLEENRQAEERAVAEKLRYIEAMQMKYANTNPSAPSSCRDLRAQRIRPKSVRAQGPRWPKPNKSKPKPKSPESTPLFGLFG